MSFTQREQFLCCRSGQNVWGLWGEELAVIWNATRWRAFVPGRSFGWEPENVNNTLWDLYFLNHWHSSKTSSTPRRYMTICGTCAMTQYNHTNCHRNWSITNSLANNCLFSFLQKATKRMNSMQMPPALNTVHLLGTAHSPSRGLHTTAASSHCLHCDTL